ncbi:MAG: hypothetical protein D3908_08895, partial [Candidatus Electrothrix sp. AUS4]|nr:hypothetical protein [Candidatus Electrothrix sp. AUS4]
MSDAGNYKDCIPVGKVTKAHALRGEIKVYPFSGSPENMLRYKELFLQTEDATSPLSYQVERARIQKNSVLLQLKGCTDRNAAEKLVQAQVYVH